MHGFVTGLLALASAATLAQSPPDTFAAGKVVYQQTCIVCHGANGKGAIPGVADLTAASGALSKSDDALLKSIREGFQRPGAALAMPAKGGNPALSDAQLKAVLAYLRAAFGK